MGLVFSVAAFAFVLVVARRSLGHGLGATLLVGYSYALIRAWFPDGFSHFVFDSALVALYLARLFPKSVSERLGDRVLAKWLAALVCWPIFTIVLSPLVASQHVIIQLIGLRAAVFMLPTLLVASRIQPEDLDTLTRWVLALNFSAFLVGTLQYQIGIEPFFPQTPVTAIMYRSRDVGPDASHRIPAIFSSAHAYAGTMLATLPIVIRRWQRDRGFAIVPTAALVATVLGIFMSGARAPVVQLASFVALWGLLTRVNFRTVLLASVVACAVAYSVASSPRLRRFETITDLDAVEERVSYSLNLSLLEVVLDYPLGNGLGSAVGTSIPFFLEHFAIPQIGLENEYARIAMEQGVIGLTLWVAFLLWLMVRIPRRDDHEALWRRLSWALTLVTWGTAFIGTGMLTSIPGTLVLMLSMGALARRSSLERPVTRMHRRCSVDDAAQPLAPSVGSGTLHFTR